jgi:hypothetical protein
MISGPLPCPIYRSTAWNPAPTAYPLALSVGISLDASNLFFSKSPAWVGLGADVGRFSVIFLFV